MANLRPRTLAADSDRFCQHQHRYEQRDCSDCEQHPSQPGEDSGERYEFAFAEGRRLVSLDVVPRYHRNRSAEFPLDPLALHETKSDSYENWKRDPKRDHAADATVRSGCRFVDVSPATSQLLPFPS